jgi:hypothetical protein
MKEKVIDRTIPRIKVGFINKIRRGLKALIGELTQTLKQLEFARFDEERQIIYRYVTYRLQWHIAARIGRKFKNCGEGRPASDRKPEDRSSDAEVIEIENERKMIGEQICKVHDWLVECIRFNEEAKDLNDNPLAVTRALNALKYI